MRQWKYKEKVPYLLLVVLTVVFCQLVCGVDGVFGSKVDWISQHSVLPDYFRQQFYETGQLFSEFAANIGGGQNIYEFSYYGLYSPVVLFSYLFPFVKMGDYLMAASVVSLVVSVLLFYRWLQRREISLEVCFFASLIFLLAGPMVYHSYNQVMFVNYMPFLCMAFFGVDRYFERQKAGLYVLGVFLMILTSFYFSVGGLLVLVIYGLYRYLEEKENAGQKIRCRRFFADGVRFFIPMLTAILMSGILLVPTALALGGGRAGKSSLEMGSLLLPDIQIFRFIYSPYGIGLTTLVFIVLMTGVTYRRRSERVLQILCIIVLTVPIFTYLLNGGLYLRDKVMIPFLPLLCFLIARYLEKQKRKEIPVLAGIFPALLTLLLLYLWREQVEYSRYWKLILIDGGLMLVGIGVYYWKKWYRILAVLPICFLMVYGVVLHSSADKVLDKSFYEKVTDEQFKEAVETIQKTDPGLYRIEQSGTVDENAANLNRVWSMKQYISPIYSSSYNADYQEFRKRVFELEQPHRNILMQSISKNPIYQRFMGVKYILSQNEVPGYVCQGQVGNIGIYRNEEALPMIYGTNQVLSEEEYRELEFPYNQTALLEAAVVKGSKKETMPEKAAYPIEWILPEQSGKTLNVKRTADGYKIRAEKVQNVEVEIGEHTGADTLFLQFQVKNRKPSKDVSIWLEGVKNKLSAGNHLYYNENTTFTYAVPLKDGQREVNFGLGAGTYEICEIHCYTGEISGKTDILCQASFEPDPEQTKGNVIAGKIEMKQDGWGITSIPFDQGFEIRIDGERAAIEKVNTAFLGCRLAAGTHEIEIIYHAPGVKFGKWCSLCGIVLFVLLEIMKKKEQKAFLM